MAAATTSGVHGGQGRSVYLLGWTGDFGDPDNFLDVHFGAVQPQFGFNNHASCSRLLDAGGPETDTAKRDGALPAGQHLAS